MVSKGSKEGDESAINGRHHKAVNLWLSADRFPTRQLPLAPQRSSRNNNNEKSNDANRKSRILLEDLHLEAVRCWHNITITQSPPRHITKQRPSHVCNNIKTIWTTPITSPPVYAECARQLAKWRLVFSSRLYPTTMPVCLS